MTLTEADVDLIRASWGPARRDPTGAGVLLFKGLFTKFPDYLKLFNQFVDLDIENIQENKRLVKHAVKVIETVTFVVNSIGDPAKSDQLNEALVGLVRGHLKRKIGLSEFRNLGIVLIDFICDLNNRRDYQQLGGGSRLSLRANSDRLDGTSGGGGIDGGGIDGGGSTATRDAGHNSSRSSSQDSETMTSTLDKIRASSSPSSSSEDEILLARSAAPLDDGDVCELLAEGARASHANHRRHNAHKQQYHNQDHNANCEAEKPAKLDASQLVAAWTKLYGVILDLVRSEEGPTGRQ